MNEEVTNKANEVLLKMLEGIDKGSDFAIDKAPEVVQQLLMWTLCSQVGIIILTTILIFISYKVFLKATKMDDYDEMIGPMFVISGVVAIVNTVFLLVTLFKGVWLKALVAPDLFLLEYAAKLV